MNGYFKPLRRKLGVVTLVTACVFTAGWVRSLFIQDSFNVPTGVNTSVMLVCGSNSFLLATTVAAHSTRPMSFGHWMDRLRGHDGWIIHCGDNGTIFANSAAFRPGHFGVSLGQQTNTIHTFQIPFWSIVVPLTLLSAWMLLSKPRGNPTDD